MKKPLFDPAVGDVVCDCRMKHLKIIKRDGDDVTLEDGTTCSLYHCCESPDHTWKHEDVRAAAMKEWP